VTTTDLVDRLAAHRTLAAAPRTELEWLAAHGAIRHLDDGDVMTTKGVPISGLFVFLSGQVAIFVDRGAGRHKAMEWRGGDVGGVLPYSRLVSGPGDSIALEPTEVFVMRRQHLDDMIRECPGITSILVHKMLDRARLFTSSELRDERMTSLGKLSAGLAHELNNPVAAIERSAARLEDHLAASEQATRALAAARLSGDELAAIDVLQRSCIATPMHGVLSPIQQAEREDALADWLADHGVGAAVAEPLAETAVTIEDLDRIAGSVRGQALDAVLRSTAASCTIRHLAAEIQGAATRISGIVVAIKGFTHMDQAMAAGPVDVAAGLGQTVTILNAKARAKSATVTVTTAPGLPPVLGFAGELNQIWANLIDNALDAIPDRGRVDVTAARERQRVVVRVVDNGPGIAPDVREHIFEPFVTTKPVGQGTGLGLDIVRRLLMHNDAEIELESTPGRTEFRVVLRTAESDAPAPRP
jgi:signal transduction histidine kinase